MDTQENDFKHEKIINRRSMARVKSAILFIAGAVAGILAFVIFLERSGNIADVDPSTVSGSMMPLDATLSLSTIDSKPIAMRLVQGKAELSVCGDVVMVELCANSAGMAQIILEYDNSQLEFQGAPWYRTLKRKAKIDGGATDRLIITQLVQNNYILLFHNKTDAAPSILIKVESADSETFETILSAPVVGT